MPKLNLKSKGFTLIELLIALLVFSLMASMIFSGLSSLMSVPSTMDQENEYLAQSQRLMYQWERYLRQITLHKDDEKNSLNFNPDNHVYSIRAHQLASASSQKLTTKRHFYKLEDGKLSYYLLNSELGDSPSMKDAPVFVVEAVRDFFIEPIKETDFIVGFKLVIEHVNYGKLERFFFVPQKEAMITISKIGASGSSLSVTADSSDSDTTDTQDEGASSNSQEPHVDPLINEDEDSWVDSHIL